METVNAPPQSPQQGTRPSRYHNRRRNPQQTSQQRGALAVTTQETHYTAGVTTAGNAMDTRNPHSDPSTPTSAAGDTLAAPQSTSAGVVDVAASSNGDIRNPHRAHRRRGGPQDRVSSSVTGNSGLSSQTGATTRSDSSRSVIGSRRQFGGHLTSTSTETQAFSNSTSSLSADATEFRPTSQQSVRPSQTSSTGPPIVKANGLPPRRQTGRSPKSSAPDLATRIHEDVENGVYECPICAYEVGRKSKIWYCGMCWTVFHLSCIKKWSQNEGSGHVERSQNGEMQPPKMWRCPGCNLPKETMPTTYACWCGKELEPRTVPGLPPHSCGQTCGRPRTHPRKCPHPCELICHAGPCPPCAHMGPTQSCYCGKEAVTRKCLDTNYEEGWCCDQVCGDLMPCGEHVCQRKCHQGLCGACEVKLEARCYCGKVENLVSCCDRGQERKSKESVDEDGLRVVHSWIGSFTCQNTCGRPYDCGKHVCEQGCHVRCAEPAHCPRSPDVVSHCPCGKTRIRDLQGGVRESCEDPIPNCDKRCLKRLPCGHECMQVCHAGECMPCMQPRTIACRCGRTKNSTICHQSSVEPPWCMRICRATLNCGRHECGERCCPGERKAMERQSSKRKQRPLDAGPLPPEEGIEVEHICTRPCGRKLKCGNHFCPELCHKGPCGSCREAIFDELPCHCGRTVLQPPLPCGTKPPPCRYNCERPKLCEHPQVAHNCHGDDEECPNCPFLTEKLCICGKKSLKNQPCWRSDVSCGEICGKLLRCGSHNCRKTCHGPGECEDRGSPCRQMCGKPKKTCQHPCEEQCHAPFACREDKPCQRKILVTCACQHIKKEVRCNASKTNEGNQKETLNCDDECARLERNRKLALALNIDPETHKDEHIPYSKETLDLYSNNIKWAQTQERGFRIFAADESEKRIRFKPMPGHQRAFLHALAEDFGFDSESLDPEPHRHVIILKTPRFVMAPMKTLAQCMEIRSNSTRSAIQVTDPHPTKLNGTSPDLHFNAFLLLEPRFALTQEELHSHLGSLLSSPNHPKLAFETHFLQSESIILQARPSSKLSEHALSSTLVALKPSLRHLLRSKSLASTALLCRVDNALHILYQEPSEGTTTGGPGGWSTVAAKAAAPRTMVKEKGPMGEKSVFTVLGSRVREKETKKTERIQAPVVVADDWEKAEEEEELKERAVAVAHEKEDEEGKGQEIVEGGGKVVHVDTSNRIL